VITTHRRFGALALGGLVTLVAATGCGSSDDSSTTTPAAAAKKSGPLELKIGMSAALAGAFAPFDTPEVAGMEYAAKKINAAGGYKGVTVKIITEDNKGTANATSTTTQDLLDKGVKAFVLTTADSSVASGQLIAKAGGVMTMGVNTPPVLTQEAGPMSFFETFADNVQAAAQAEYACDQGYKNAYELVDPESPYTSVTTMGKYFKEAFAKTCNGTVSGTDTFKIGATSFSSQVTKIQNASPKPDVIFTSMFVPDSGTFLKQLRGAGVKTPYLGTDGDDDPLLVKTAGSAADGAVYATHGFPASGGDLEAFLADFKSVTGEAPETNTFEAIGRDQVYVLAEAAARAHSTDPAAIAAQLKTMKGFKAVQGTINMDPDTRIPDLQVSLVKIEDGKPTLVKAVVPAFVPNP
jgi:branched-chain amino acid transport system substrate-binding protein